MADKKYSIDDILRIFSKLEKKIEDLACFVKECCAKIPVNVGTGIGLFKKFNQNKWEFKSLLPGNNVTITQTNNEVVISSTFDCEEVKDCIGITPAGDPNKYLNEQGDFLTITIPPNFITAIADTSSIDLTVTGTTLSADFINNAGYITLSSLSGGTGISYNNLTGVITNTAPDQTVVLTQGGTTTITGTYPNFTISSADQYTGTVTSVGLSMPSAFNVANSPVTSSGTLTVTGAGLTSQYIRGDGTLANFPTNVGGGSSVSYYLNGSVNQGTFGGNTYYQMSRIANTGPAANFTLNANGYIANFITDPGDPALLNIPAGNWDFQIYFSASSSGGSPQFYTELYKYNGTTFTLISSGSTAPQNITNGTFADVYTSTLTVPTTTLSLTDRLAVRIYVLHSGRTITMYTQDNRLAEVHTTFSTGLAALNGLTTQVQYLSTGTTGTDFNISSATDTHTFNLPIASGTNTGKLSSTDWTTFNNKQAALGFTPEDVANKSTTTTLGTSNTLYPTQNAVKTYVDTAVASANPASAKLFNYYNFI